LKLITLLGLAIVLSGALSIPLISGRSFAFSGGSLEPPTFSSAHLVYLFRGDAIDFKYFFKGLSWWSILISVTQLSSGRRWVYSDSGSVEEPVTPVFRAPSTDVYLVRLKVTNATSSGKALPNISFMLSVRPSSIDVRINYLVPRLLLIVVIGLALMFAGLLIGLRSSVTMQIISREIQDLWKDVIMIVFLIVFLLIRGFGMNNLVGWSTFAERFGRVSISSNLFSLLHRVSFTYTPYYGDGLSPVMLYLIYSAIIAVALFTYEFEKKLFRDKLCLGIGRGRLYLSKVAALFLLLLIPLAIPHAFLMAAVDTSIITSKPSLFLQVIANGFIADLITVVLVASLILLPSILLPKTFYTLMALLAIPYILSILNSPLTLGALTQLVMYGDFNYEVLLYYGAAFTASVIGGYFFVRFRDYA